MRFLIYKISMINNLLIRDFGKEKLYNWIFHDDFNSRHFNYVSGSSCFFSKFTNRMTINVGYSMRLLNDILSFTTLLEKNRHYERRLQPLPAILRRFQIIPPSPRPTGPPSLYKLKLTRQKLDLDNHKNKMK